MVIICSLKLHSLTILTMAVSLPRDPYEASTDAGDHVALTFKLIDEYHEIQLARDGAAGAICSFIGTTRDNFQGTVVNPACSV